MPPQDEDHDDEGIRQGFDHQPSVESSPNDKV